MKSSLARRLEDIPGVASVVIDLEGFGRGIDVRLEDGANEAEVMEQLQALLAAYGVRGERGSRMQPKPEPTTSDTGVKVIITPIRGGARVEVESEKVKSFRVTASNPEAIAQGLADAWCQVVGRIPVEVEEVVVSADGTLSVTCSDGDTRTTGSANVNSGWEQALREAVAGALFGGDGSSASIAS